MASLKEIKGRIESVRSTRKTTSAMKMVAAAKLHRAQRNIGSLVPYSEELQTIVTHLATGEGVGQIPLAERRELRRVRIVGFASNSTLCGAYNVNVAKDKIKCISLIIYMLTSFIFEGKKPNNNKKIILIMLLLFSH